MCRGGGGLYCSAGFVLCVFVFEVDFFFVKVFYVVLVLCSPDALLRSVTLNFVLVGWVLDAVRLPGYVHAATAAGSGSGCGSGSCAESADVPLAAAEAGAADTMGQQLDVQGPSVAGTESGAGASAGGVAATAKERRLPARPEDDARTAEWLARLKERKAIEEQAKAEAQTEEDVEEERVKAAHLAKQRRSLKRQMIAVRAWLRHHAVLVSW